MATAATILSGLPKNETENYIRLQLLLMRATDVLRDVLRTQLQTAYPGLFDPSKTDTLYDVLNDKRVKYSLLRLRKRNVLNPSHMQILYPSSTPSTTVTLQDLDLTLLVVLLRNITKLNPHAKWDNPPATDTSIEANIGRVKTYRNKYAHRCLGITDTDFQAGFNGLKHVLLSLSPIYTSDDYDDLQIVTLDAKAPPCQLFSVQLPGKLADLKGREDLVQQIQQHIAGETRLVLLTGMGGIGKTSVAIEVGHREQNVLYFDMRQVTNLESVKLSLVQHYHPTLSLKDLYSDYQHIFIQTLSSLTSGTAMIFDNSDEVIKSNLQEFHNLIQDILNSTKHVTLLCTSREAFSVTSHNTTVIDVLPLDKTSSIDILWEGKTASPTDSESIALGEIAEKCRGNPIKLKLSSAQLKQKSPQEVLDRMNKNIIESWDFREKFGRLCVSGAVPVYRQRVAIVGPYGVGKTHLVKRLLQEEYDEETDAYTPGVKIYRHRCIVHRDNRSCWVRGKDDPEDQLIQHMAIGIQKPDAFRRKNQVDQDPSVKSREVEEVIYDRTQELGTVPSLGDSERHASPDRAEAKTDNFKNFDPDLVNKIESVARGEPVDPEKQITIWDFGGQDVYYTTHQTFLSEQNIYLLVFRLDVNLDTKIPVYRGEKTVKEFIVYWLNSIHMHTVGKLKEDKSVIPHVLIIGTHKDKLVSEEAADEIIGELRDYLDDKKELNDHVFRFFAISNLADVEEFDKIKGEVEYLCGYSRDREAGRQMHPVRWFQLELDLAKKSEERPIIDIEELRVMARLVGIRDAELDEMFIPYHHHLGDVLHFKVDGLENIVILDPQWLADLFSAIMTPPVSKSGKDRLDHLKRGLEKGELDEEVFDVYLHKEKMTDIKNEVIQLMQYFDLMFDISESVQTPLPPSEKRTFVVPCMLKSNDLANYQTSEAAREISLFISFPHGFFPPGLFHRLVIRLLRLYKALEYKNITPVVGFDRASFRLEDKTSVLHLFTAEKDIELVITNAIGPPKPHVYFKARQTVEDELSYLQKTYCPRMHFSYYIRVNGDRHKISIEAETVLQMDAICVCVENAEVLIDLRPYRVWFSGEEAMEKVPLVSRMHLKERNLVVHGEGRTEEKEKGLPHNQSLETASAQTSSTGMEDMPEVKVRPCSVDLFQEKAFDDKNVYKNYTEWRGRAVIINNVSFDNNYYPDREGTEVDVERMESLFQQLHYLVSRHDNMTAGAINQLAERESRTDHSVYSSFIMVILSHGGENTVIGTGGYHIGYDQILAHFEASNCPTLKGYPKMFFISACQSPSQRGDESASGVKSKPKQMTTKPQNTSSNTEDSKIAEKADIILVTSTTTGDKSWRSPTHGTWFIQSLVRELSERACDTHLLDILTQVNRSVSEMKTQDGCRQVSEITRCTLTKYLYFWPGFYVKDGETKKFPE